MTVRDLIDLLNDFNGDMEVVMKPSNSMYVDAVCNIKQSELNAFWGEDKKVCVITSDGQVGSV